MTISQSTAGVVWTDGADGEPISLYCAFNELDEARFVVNRSKTWQDNGG